MPTRAKIYIAGVITLGALQLTIAVLRWHSSNVIAVSSLALLAVVASALKVRLPQISSTISGNCIFILIGICVLPLPETIAIACASALMQSIWRPKRRPLPLQIAFNVGALVTSATVSYWVVWQIPPALDHFRPLAITAAGCVFFVLNTGAVALVLSFVEDKPPQSMWGKNYWFSLPYYVLASSLAALFVASINYRGRPFIAALLITLLALFWILRAGGLPAAFRTSIDLRRRRRYEGIHASVGLRWEDRHGEQHEANAHVLDISSLGARLECHMPASADILRVTSDRCHLSVDAEVQSCQFVQGTYIVAVEFFISLTRAQLADFLVTREAVEV